MYGVVFRGGSRSLARSCSFALLKSFRRGACSIFLACKIRNGMVQATMLRQKATALLFKVFLVREVHINSSPNFY